MEDFYYGKARAQSGQLPEGLFKTFIEAYDIKTTDDIRKAMADLVGGTV